MERDEFRGASPRADSVPVIVAPTASAVAGSSAAEPSLGELLKRLTDDTGDLVRQEVTLARAELRQAGSTLAADGTKLGVAVGLALAGLLALTAFLVIAFGLLISNFWLSALIIGVVLLGIGAYLARNAVQDIKRGLVPDQTIASLREDAAWAKQEKRAVTRELTQ